MDTEDTCNGHGMNMDTTQNGQGTQKEWTRNRPRKDNNGHGK